MHLHALCLRAPNLRALRLHAPSLHAPSLHALTWGPPAADTRRALPYAMGADGRAAETAAGYGDVTV